MDAKPGNEQRRPLRQVAPGVFVDPGRCTVPEGRRVLLMDDAGYAAIGLTPAQQKTLFRLSECGKIVIYRVAPRVTLLDAESWRQHLRRVADDPWYWENADNMNAYRGTYAGEG